MTSLEHICLMDRHQANCSYGKEVKGVGGGGSKFYCTKCLARAASSENENQALENCSLRPGTVTW